MNWFKRHLNWTLVSVWVCGILLSFLLVMILPSAPSSEELATNLGIYQDRTCSKEANLAMFSDIQWTEAKQEGWQEAIGIVYLRNEGGCTIEVSASSTSDPRMAVPGWSVSSETVRIKSGEIIPLPMRLSYNPFVVSMIGSGGMIYYQIAIVDDYPSFWYFFYFFWIIAVYCTAGWVLKQKGRSLWWLALLGIGILITLCLDNER